MNDTYPKFALAGLLSSALILALLNSEFVIKFLPYAIGVGSFIAFFIGLCVWHFSKLPDSTQGMAPATLEEQTKYVYSHTAPPSVLDKTKGGGEWVLNLAGSDEEVDKVVEEIFEEDRKRDAFGFVERKDSFYDLDWEIDTEDNTKARRQLQKVNNS